MKQVRSGPVFRVFLLTLAAWAVACSGGSEIPNLILHNGQLLDEGPATKPPSAVAIAADKILALGSDPEILALSGPGTRVIDLEGATVAPAFSDHHVHLLNLGLSLVNGELQTPLFADLSGVASLQDLVNRLALFGASQPAGSWILGKGWSQASWGESGMPTHSVLSEAFPDRPVFLTRVDGHAGWLNQEALKRAGISRQTPDPEGGRILRFPDGEPSGVLLERANELVVPELPSLTDGMIRRAFRTAAEALAQRGFTRVYDAGFLAPPGIVALNFDLERILELLIQEDRENPLPIDVYLMVPAPTRLAEDILTREAAGRKLSERIRVSHIKLFADGAMGSRGASLSQPFADQPATSGVPRMTREAIRDWSLRALDAGLDVATHAIGDLAVHETLDAYQEVLEMRPGTPPGRLRIEHFSYASQEDIERAARMQIVLSIQPNFIIPNNSGQTMEDLRVGSENSDRVYAWGTLNRLGARLAGGSDYFNLPGSALQTYHSALTRTNPENRPANGWHPEQRLPPAVALGLLDSFHPPGGGPASSGLVPGKEADLVILSRNPLTTPAADLLGIEVLGTLRRGQPVFGSLGKQGSSARK